MSNILITGDIHLGSVWSEGMPEDGNLEKLFGEFLPIINNSDLAVTNLESPITTDGNPIIKTGPILKSSIESLAILKKAGFDLLTLANNHIMDYGKPGLDSTLEECQKQDLNFVGAGNCLNEARKSFVTQIEDKKVSILNFAENEFSTIGAVPYGANPMDPIENSYDIEKAKILSDYVIVIVHGGREHYQLPSPNFQKTLRFYANCGADAVIAHHTHCVSGYEVYNDTPIFYGIGNFLFNKPNNSGKPLWNTGLAVELKFENLGRLSFQLHPYNQCIEGRVGVEVIKGDKKVEFFNKIEELNKIICNDQLLKNHWDEYIAGQRKYYKRTIFIHNKWLKKLVNRNLIPVHFLINKEYKTLIINLIRCETHREIVLDSLIKKDKR